VSSRTEVGRLSGEYGCSSAVRRIRPMAWPARPTARKGQYSFHHRAWPALRKVQLRLSWKFQRLATKNADVE
jgi:hypothetical protein